MSTYLPRRRGFAESSLNLLHLNAGWQPLACAAALAVIGGAAFLKLPLPGVSSSLSLRRDAGSSVAAIEVQSASCERRYDYVTVTGLARNIGSRPLDHTEAVVEFYGEDGGLLKVESAMLEFAKVAPGGDSAFVVHARETPGMASYRVRFRSILGTAIPSRTD